MDSGDGDDWASARVKSAREFAPVDDAVATVLKEMIRDAMADRPLSAGDQVRLAKELLATLAEGGK